MKNILKFFAVAMLVFGASAFAEEAAEAPLEKKASVASAPGIAQKPEAPVEKDAIKRGLRDTRRNQMPNAEQRLKQLNNDAQKILELYDADKDGKLNDEERAKMDADFVIAAKLQRYVRSKALLDAVDADKDMAVKGEEVKNLHKAVQKTMRDRFEREKANRGPRPGMRPNGAKRPSESVPPAAPAEEKAAE